MSSLHPFFVIRGHLNKRKNKRAKSVALTQDCNDRQSSRRFATAHIAIKVLTIAHSIATKNAEGAARARSYRCQQSTLEAYPLREVGVVTVALAGRFRRTASRRLPS